MFVDMRVTSSMRYTCKQKPENVLRMDTGAAKIADFGISARGKLVTDASGATSVEAMFNGYTPGCSSQRPPQHTLTTPCVAHAEPADSAPPQRAPLPRADDSPEVRALVRQGRGTIGPLEARHHDQWALGLILTEMVLGEKKWHGDGSCGCNFVPDDPAASGWSDPVTWSVEQVQAWLERINLKGKAGASFVEREVDGPALLHLDKATLQETHGLKVVTAVRILNARLRLAWPLPMPHQLTALLRRCLADDPEARPFATSQVADELAGMAASPPPQSTVEAPLTLADKRRFHNSMGTALKDQLARYDDAREHYDEYLRLAEEEGDPEAPGVATALNNLASLLQVCGSTT